MAFDFFDIEYHGYASPFELPRRGPGALIGSTCIDDELVTCAKRMPSSGDAAFAETEHENGAHGDHIPHIELMK